MDFLTKDKKDKITEFVKFVKEQLELKKCPVVIVQNGRGDLKTTTNYNYADEKKKINTKIEKKILL